MVLSWILKKPLDDHEDYDDDEEDPIIEADTELLYPPSPDGKKADVVYNILSFNLLIQYRCTMFLTIFH